jgi:hypothetical protein
MPVSTVLWPEPGLARRSSLQAPPLTGSQVRCREDLLTAPTTQEFVLFCCHALFSFGCTILICLATCHHTLLTTKLNVGKTIIWFALPQRETSEKVGRNIYALVTLVMVVL